MVPIRPRKGVRFSLGQLQDLVGGYIEIVYLDASTALVCDEDGKLKGYPVNGLATSIYRDSARFFNTPDFIVGDIVICNINQIPE